jgi:hypothetical protein
MVGLGKNKYKRKDDFSHELAYTRLMHMLVYFFLKLGRVNSDATFRVSFQFTTYLDDGCSINMPCKYHEEVMDSRCYYSRI